MHLMCNSLLSGEGAVLHHHHFLKTVLVYDISLSIVMVDDHLNRLGGNLL